MKHIILLGALLLSTASYAGNNLTIAPRHAKATEGTMKMMARSGMSKMTPVTNDILTMVPEGERMTEVLWSSEACYPGNGGLAWAEVSGFVPTIVTVGNTMYIASPLTALSEIAQAWIKGEISEDGTKVIFQTPQAYMLNEPQPGNVIMLYATRVDAQTGKPVEGNTDLVFSYIDGELTQTDGGLLALTDIQGNFYGYGDKNISVKKIKDKPVVLPADAEDGSYYMEFGLPNDRMKQSAVIAFKDYDLYFSDPVGVPDAWYKGTMQEDGSVVVKTPQYIGAGSGYPLYLVTGKQFTRTEVDPMTGMEYEVIDYTVEAGKDIVFSFDEENDSYSTSQLLLFSSNPDKKGDASAPFPAPLYMPWEPTLEVPAAPEVTFYLDLKEYEAFGLAGSMTTIVVPYESVDGKFIPQENIYYQIWFDEKPLEFYGATYLPFYGQFQDASIATSLTVSGTTHQLQTLQKPEHSLSVQSYYQFGSTYIPSEKNTYEIVDGQLQGSGVATVDAEEVVNVEYYDFAGRKLNGDEEGFIIRRETLSNGKTRVTKTFNSICK